MKKIVLLLAAIMLSFAATAQDKYSFRAYTEGGITFESTTKFHPEYGFGVSFYRNLSPNIALGVDVTPTKTFSNFGTRLVHSNYYIPVSITIQDRLFESNISPVISLSAGYSFLIPQTKGAKPINNSQSLDYLWGDYTNPDLLDENGNLRFGSKEEYAEYLRDEKGMDHLFPFNEDTQEYELDKGLLNQYLSRFSNGDTRYFEKGVDFVQNGWFFNIGIGCDYKLSDYRVGFLAEAGLYQVFNGAITRNEKNEYEYFSQKDYLCRETEREVNGDIVKSYERGRAVLVAGKRTESFYPKVSLKLYVAF